MEEQWIVQQDAMKERIIKTDQFDPNNIKYIGGVDISFDKNDPDRACAYLTVLDYLTLESVYENHRIVKLTVPYISGFLAFREVDHYLTLLNELMDRHPEFKPDVILVDGFGTLHHRGFGSASHLGVMIDIPTIGCGKTLMCLDGLDEKQIKDQFKIHHIDPMYSLELRGLSNVVHGIAIRTKDSTNPIYISVGHKISLETSVAIVRKMCRYRIPEPIRLSDIRSKVYLI